MTRIHIGKAYYAKKKMRWVSFETDPVLATTRREIYTRCVPCITNLYEQLRAGNAEVNLGMAFRCWKVVVVLPGDDQCVELLGYFERDFLGERSVKGRFGSGDETKSSRVVVFNAENAEDKDRLLEELRVCAQRINPDAPVTAHRGCIDLYHGLFGDSSNWHEVETIKNPDLVQPILDHIRKVLYWEKKENNQ
jgi:hypothetical protein